MNATSIKSPDRLIANLAGLRPSLETAYKDSHAHPELSMHEHRAAQHVMVGSSGAPVIHPTLEAGIEAIVVAALAWLAK